VNSEAGRRPPAARSRQVEGDRWGVVLSGGGLGLLLAVIPIALCDYSGHGVFMANKRLELLLLGMLVGACGGRGARGLADEASTGATRAPVITRDRMSRPTTGRTSGRAIRRRVGESRRGADSVLPFRLPALVLGQRGPSTHDRTNGVSSPRNGS